MRKTRVKYYSLSWVAQAVLLSDPDLHLLYLFSRQRVIREAFNRQESTCPFQQARNLVFRAESDRGTAFSSGEIKGFHPTELFHSIATIFILCKKFCFSGQDHRMNVIKQGRGKTEAF